MSLSSKGSQILRMYAPRFWCCDERGKEEELPHFVSVQLSYGISVLFFSCPLLSYGLPVQQQLMVEGYLLTRPVPEGP